MLSQAKSESMIFFSLKIVITRLDQLVFSKMVMHPSEDSLIVN